MRRERESAVEEVHHALVEACVAEHFLRERAHLFARGKLSVNYEVGGFDECRIFREHLNRNSPITEDSLFAVDVCDCAFARPCVCKSFVERNVARLRAELRNVYALVARRAFYDGKLVSLFV